MDYLIPQSVPSSLSFSPVKNFVYSQPYEKLAPQKYFTRNIFNTKISRSSCWASAASPTLVLNAGFVCLYISLVLAPGGPPYVRPYGAKVINDIIFVDIVLLTYLDKAFSRMATESEGPTRPPPPVGLGKSRGGTGRTLIYVGDERVRDNGGCWKQRSRRKPAFSSGERDLERDVRLKRQRREKRALASTGRLIEPGVRHCLRSRQRNVCSCS